MHKIAKWLRISANPHLNQNANPMIYCHTSIYAI